MRLRSWKFAAFVCFALLCVFWLPLAVPPKPNFSASWVYGFNNKVSLLAFLAALIIGAFALRGDDLSVSEQEPKENLPLRTLWIALGATTLACAVMTLICYPVDGIEETPYLLNRIRVLLTGVHPYTGFEFIYGPALLYIPWFFAKILRFSSFWAYFATWYLMWLAGTALQFLVIRSLRFPRWAARGAFWFLWWIFVPALMGTGLQFTPVRQLSVIVAMLLYDRVYTRRPGWMPVFAAVGLQAGLFLLSPELAIAFAAAAVTYTFCAGFWGGTQRRSAGAVLAHIAGMVAGFALLTVFVLKLHVLDSAKEFGGGAADIPLLLTPGSFCVLACVFLAAAFCVFRLRHNAVHGPAVATALAGFSLLAGAFGRADLGHLAIYLVGGVLVALLLAAQRQRLWRPSIIALSVLVVVPLMVTRIYAQHLAFLQSAVEYALPNGRTDTWMGRHLLQFAVRHGGPASVHKLMVRATKGSTDPAEVFTSETPVMMAPFGYYVPTSASLHSNVALGYMDGMNDMLGTPQIERKEQELATHPERDLLLPHTFGDAERCAAQPQDFEGLLRAQYGFNYLRPHNQMRMLVPFCQYILDRYTLKEASPDPRFHYDLWTLKSGSPK